MKIIGVGDNTVDVYLHQNKMYPGGNSVNVPVLCRRAGAEEAAYIGIFGDDEAGELMMRSLKEEGLDVSRVRRIHGTNSKNGITLNEENDRTWAGNNFGGDCGLVQLLFNNHDVDYIAQYDVLHTSVHSELPYLLPLVKGKVMISMDFSDGYTDDRIRRLCPYLDVAFFSGSGCTREEIDETIKKALDAGTKIVVTTMGMDGSIVTDGKERIFQPAIKATEPVIDTLGAGDTYIAAFLLTYFETRDMQKAALHGAQFALTALLENGAFGHGEKADPSGIVLKSSREYQKTIVLENRGF